MICVQLDSCKKEDIYGCLLLGNNITVNFPGGSVVKNLPAVQEMQVWFLGQEDPLEKGIATHSSILDWRILRTAEPGEL